MTPKRRAARGNSSLDAPTRSLRRNDLPEQTDLPYDTHLDIKFQPQEMIDAQALINANADLDRDAEATCPAALRVFENEP